MSKVTVLIPLGPKPIYRTFIQEAVQSILNQTYPASSILLVDDGAKVSDQEIHEWFDVLEQPLGYVGNVDGLKMWVYDAYDGPHNHPAIYVWSAPTNLGFISAFNCGMALAPDDLVMYLATDDTLSPDAIRDAVETYEANNQKDAWYSLTYESAEGVSDIPINAAMITRNLWKWLGGYPPSAFAGPDALVLSRLMVHAPDRIIKVAPGKVNYKIKTHSEQETKKQFSFFAASGIMEVIRNMETQRFVPNTEIILK